jgi:hypothetical protein
MFIVLKEDTPRNPALRKYEVNGTFVPPFERRFVADILLHGERKHFPHTTTAIADLASRRIIRSANFHALLISCRLIESVHACMHRVTDRSLHVLTTCAPRSVTQHVFHGDITLLLHHGRRLTFPRVVAGKGCCCAALLTRLWCLEDSTMMVVLHRNIWDDSG